jgi:hypothetical protein
VVILKNALVKIAYISSISCICLSFSYAVEPIKAPLKIASMVASPNSCQLEETQEICEMTFHIIWQTPSIGNYCLHSTKSTQPLKCWYQKKRGSITLTYFSHILDSPKVYTLLDDQGDVFIASVTVPVAGSLKQRQRAQRRRRGFWRMF